MTTIQDLCELVRAYISAVVPSIGDGNVTGTIKDRAKRLIITSAVLLSTGVMPAAAQVGETSSNLCGTGIDVLIGLLASIIVIGGFVYGMFEGGMGLIKYDNPDPSKSKEGAERVRSGVVSMVGPALFFLVVAVAAEISGFGIASCFIPDIGVFSTVTPPVGTLYDGISASF